MENRVHIEKTGQEYHKINLRLEHVTLHLIIIISWISALTGQQAINGLPSFYEVPGTKRRSLALANPETHFPYILE